MLKPVRFVPPGTRIPFVAQRRYAFGLSAAMVLASLAALLLLGLNFGIDFRGGILMEVRAPGKADIPAMRDSLSGLGLGEERLRVRGGRRRVGHPAGDTGRRQQAGGRERAQPAGAEGSDATHRRVGTAQIPVPRL